MNSTVGEDGRRLIEGGDNFVMCPHPTGDEFNEKKYFMDYANYVA